MAQFELCKIDEIATGEKKRFMVEGKAIMLANVVGNFFATDDTCTHARASLTAGCLRGYEIECSWHGARFDIRSGEVKVLPAVIPLKTYPVEVRDEAVFITLKS